MATKGMIRGKYDRGRGLEFSLLASINYYFYIQINNWGFFKLNMFLYLYEQYGDSM
jgi:hypothetical protein